MNYNPYFTQKSLQFMFFNYKRRNIFITLFFMTISFGLYSISWIYNHNQMFLEVDENAPDPNKLALTLFLLPLVIFTIFQALYTIWGNLLAIEIAEIVIWAFLIFFTLKYIFLFCMSFGKITVTPGIIWYGIMYLGYSSFILAFFGFYHTLILAIFFILGIVAMQEVINATCYKIKKNQEKESFNYMNRSNSLY